MTPEHERPWQMYHELYDESFREIVDKALIKVFKPDIQKHYHVAGYAQLQDGKWIIKLERRIFPE